MVEDVLVSGLSIAGVGPPVREELARGGDHRREQHHEVDGDAGTDQRRSEAPEGVAHDDQVAAVTDSIDDGVGVIPPAGRLVVAGQIHGDRLLPSFAKLGHHQVPVPRAATAAVDQRERRHDPREIRPALPRRTREAACAARDAGDGLRGTPQPAVRATATAQRRARPARPGPTERC